MIVTTTPDVANKTVIEYKGLVTGEVIVGVNFIRDFFAGMRDFFGGRSKAYEKELEKARNLAMNELVAKAESMGANAVIGIDLDYETVSPKGSMLMVSITGTAVVLQGEAAAPMAAPAVAPAPIEEPAAPAPQFQAQEPSAPAQQPPQSPFTS